MRFMPCIYFIKLLLGRLGSGLRRYKYSAICFSTLIKSEGKIFQHYGAGLKRCLFCFNSFPLILLASGVE